MLTLRAKTYYKPEHIAVTLIVILVLSTLVGILSPLISHAAVRYSDLSQGEKIKVFSYAKYIQACYQDGRKVESNPQKVADGQLFYDAWSLDGNAVIYVANKTIQSELKGLGDNDNEITCGSDNGELTKKALSVLGINGLDLVCQMGYKREKESQGAGCKTATDQRFQKNGGIESRSDAYKRAVKSLTGLDLDHPGNDMWYLWHLNTLEAGCGVNFTPDSSAAGMYSYELKYKNSNGEKVKYGGKKPRNQWPFQHHDNYSGGSCQYALDQANNNFQDYQNVIVENNSKARCEQKGYRYALLSSCLDGVKNRDSGEYCKKYAPNDKQEEACRWGQGISDPRVPPEEPSEGDKTSCAINGIGWIVCPVIQFMADIANIAYGFLADKFLVVEADLFNRSGDGADTYKAWSAIQGLANIAFVIAFIIIIYSQLTGTGLSNYGVKKMLPRIIIAAVLVNMSYIICQLAVDISNLLGYGLRSMFNTISIEGIEGGGTIDQFNFGQTAAAVLAMGAAAALALPLLGTAVTAAVVALVFTALLLITRQALIILLVVISPLAFVAYLLPNTEHFFTKWRKMFTGLLMVFPVVGLLFGAGSLASTILKAAGDESSQVDMLIAAVVGILPLFAVWPILKGSLDAAGNIGAKINGVSRTTQGRANTARQNAQNKIGNSIGNSAFMKRHRQRKDQRNASIKAGEFEKAGSWKNPLNWRSNTQAARSSLNRGFNNSWISGSLGDSRALEASANAASLANEAQETETKNAMEMLRSKGLTSQQIQTLAAGGTVGNMKTTEAIQRAAVRSSMATNNLAENEALIAASGSMSESVRKEIAQGVAQNNLADKAAYLGGDMTEKIKQGMIKSTTDLSSAASAVISSGKLSTKSLASQDSHAIDRMSHAVVNDSTIKQSDKDNYISQAAEAATSKEINQNMTGRQKQSLDFDGNLDQFNVNHDKRP